MLDLDQLQPGDRIVLRYRLEAEPIRPGSAALTDALGETVEVGKLSVSIQTRKGLVVVPRQAITHAKRVPPAPPRRPRGARQIGRP